MLRVLGRKLEIRKLQPKEKLADYVADIKKLVIKGYPTADAQTREKINVRHFLKGLTDQQMAFLLVLGNQHLSTRHVRYERGITASGMKSKKHEFELCNLRMIVISLFQKRGFENLELRLNPVLERKLMLWLKSLMGQEQSAQYNVIILSGTIRAGLIL